jgi:hypothetical protein
MLKIVILISLLALVGCKTVFPNFPMFYSQQDLRDQEREINRSLERD